jgi:uncharacterized protein (DUF1330 family)
VNDARTRIPHHDGGDHVNPADETLAALAASGDDTPVVMLNLNRYRERAQYPDGTPDADVSGREAYLRYGAVAMEAIAATGGRILWSTDAMDVVIGCDHDRYDEVVAVWYPSRAAFLGLAAYPGYVEAMVHRDAALEQASLIATRGTPDALLSTPFASAQDAAS